MAAQQRPNRWHRQAACRGRKQAGRAIQAVDDHLAAVVAALAGKQAGFGAQQRQCEVGAQGGTLGLAGVSVQPAGDVDGQPPARQLVQLAYQP